MFNANNLYCFNFFQKLEFDSFSDKGSPDALIGLNFLAEKAVVL